MPDTTPRKLKQIAVCADSEMIDPLIIAIADDGTAWSFYEDSLHDESTWHKLPNLPPREPEDSQEEG